MGKFTVASFVPFNGRTGHAQMWRFLFRDLKGMMHSIKYCYPIFTTSRIYVAITNSSWYYKCEIDIFTSPIMFAYACILSITIKILFS